MWSGLHLWLHIVLVVLRNEKRLPSLRRVEGVERLATPPRPQLRAQERQDPMRVSPIIAICDCQQLHCESVYGGEGSELPVSD